jgi:hypothetical protein
MADSPTICFESQPLAAWQLPARLALQPISEYCSGEALFVNN